MTKETKDILSMIPPDTNFQKYGMTKEIDKNPQNAEEKILYLLGFAITKLYAQNKPIKLYFEQDENGVYVFNLYG